MESKDIVFQVSEETAEVMEEISEQLFDESAERFDKVAEAIEKAIKKVEDLYAEFTGYAGNSDKQLTSNQAELIGKLSEVLDAIGVFRKDISEQTVQVNEKGERLLEIVADIPRLIQVVSNSVSESAEAGKKFEFVIQQAISELAESLVELRKMQSNIMDKLSDDDSQEKLNSALNKLAEIENGVLQAKDAVGNISETLHNCNVLIDSLQSSVKGLQDNDEKIFNAGEEHSVLLLKKMDDVLTCLDALSGSVQTIAETQNEICEKQAEIDKDLKILKMSFFKRLLAKIKILFTKGRE